MWEFELWQDGMVVACGSGPDKEDIRREALHYVSQYGQDGPVRLVFGRVPLPAPASER